MQEDRSKCVRSVQTVHPNSIIKTIFNVKNLDTLQFNIDKLCSIRLPTSQGFRFVSIEHELDEWNVHKCASLFDVSNRNATFDWRALTLLKWTNIYRQIRITIRKPTKRKIETDRMARYKLTKNQVKWSNPNRNDEIDYYYQ